MAEGLPGTVVAVVVTFNVTAAFAEGFRAILPQVDRLVLVDNGSAPESLGLLRGIIAGEPRAELLCNPVNEGLASAQNRGIAAATAHGAAWILLLDDDSVAAPDMLPAFGRAYATVAAADPGALDTLAILAPNLRADDASPPTKVLIADHRWRWRPRRVEAAPAEPVLYVFASGSLIRGAALRRIGPMREDFFIDYIDIEYGLRANSLGYRILVVRDAWLYHHHGAPQRHRLLGRTVHTTNHSPARRFTISRNRVRVWRSYARRWPGWFLFDLTAAAVEIVLVVALEKHKLAKLRNMAAGAWAGLRQGRL